MNALSPGAELFYRRLMSVVDDFGRFHASPATLRGACWPTCPEKVCEQDVIRWISECSQSDNRDGPLVIVYTSGNSKFIQINNFKQQVRTKSKFPEPDINLISDCNQNDCTSRSRISESKSDSEPIRKPLTERTPILQLRDMWEKKGKPTDWQDWKQALEECIAANISDDELLKEVIPWAREYLSSTDVKMVISPRKLFSQTPHRWKNTYDDSQLLPKPTPRPEWMNGPKLKPDEGWPEGKIRTTR